MKYSQSKRKATYFMTYTNPQRGAHVEQPEYIHGGKVYSSLMHDSLSRSHKKLIVLLTFLFSHLNEKRDPGLTRLSSPHIVPSCPAPLSFPPPLLPLCLPGIIEAVMWVASPKASIRFTSPQELSIREIFQLDLV